MGKNSIFAKYPYLSRLMLTAVLLLILPMAMFLYFIIDHSYHELIKNNAQEYERITKAYENYFEGELLSLRNMAMAFAVQTRTDANALPRLETINNNPYYYKKVTEVLRSQSSLTDYNIMLYYPGIDALFTQMYKYSLQDYLHTIADDEETVTKMAQFFDFDPAARMVIGSTFEDLPYRSAKLYIGVPVRVGTDFQSALLVYVLGYDSINTSMFATQSAKYLNLMMFDAENHLLFTNEAYRETLFANNGLMAFLTNDAQRMLSFADGPQVYDLFKPPQSNTAIRYLTVLSSDEVVSHIQRFYQSTRNMVTLMLGFLTLLAAATVYVNYKPMLKLLEQIGQQKKRGGGEFQTIEHVFLRMQSEAAEHNMLIMESLMGNLLYGAPVPNELAMRIAPNPHEGNFCVYTLLNAKFDFSGRHQLSSWIALQCGAQVHLTDMLYEDYTVLIALMKDISADDLADLIKKGMAGLLGQAFEAVYIGDTVHSLNDIRKSYLKCLDQMKGSSAKEQALPPDDQPIATKEGELSTLCNEVLQFIATHLSQADLSQSLVADSFGLSTFSLSRLFREQMGIGFTEYVTAKRLDNAKRLLLTTSLKVAEVGTSIGIPNANYFSRLFKANVGVTPLEFRRK